MDSQHIYEELLNIHESIRDVKILSQRNAENLDYHIKRTDLLEKKLDLMETDILKVRGFFAIGGWIVGIAATVITALSRIYHF